MKSQIRLRTALAVCGLVAGWQHLSEPAEASSWTGVAPVSFYDGYAGHVIWVSGESVVPPAGDVCYGGDVVYAGDCGFHRCRRARRCRHRCRLPRRLRRCRVMAGPCCTMTGSCGAPDVSCCDTGVMGHTNYCGDAGCGAFGEGGYPCHVNRRAMRRARRVCRRLNRRARRNACCQVQSCGPVCDAYPCHARCGRRARCCRPVRVRCRRAACAPVCDSGPGHCGLFRRVIGRLRGRRAYGYGACGYAGLGAADYGCYPAPAAADQTVAPPADAAEDAVEDVVEPKSEPKSNAASGKSTEAGIRAAPPAPTAGLLLPRL